MPRSKDKMRGTRRGSIKYKTSFTTVEEDDMCSNYDVCVLTAYLPISDIEELSVLTAANKDLNDIFISILKEYKRDASL